MAFCIRDEEGKMIYAESRVMEKISVIEVEIKALRMGIEYCIEHDLVPLIIETDSLMAQKILCGIWEVTWSISLNVGYIKGLMMDIEVEVLHTYREGNSVADFFANIAFNFAGTRRKQFFNINDTPQQVQTIIQQESNNMPNLRLRRIQNTGYRMPI